MHHQSALAISAGAWHTQNKLIQKRNPRKNEKGVGALLVQIKRGPLNLSESIIYLITAEIMELFSASVNCGNPYKRIKSNVSLLKGRSEIDELLRPLNKSRRWELKLEQCNRQCFESSTEPDRQSQNGSVVS